MAEMFVKIMLSMVLLGGVLQLQACGSSVARQQQRFFFPPAPDIPKIEYVTSYFSDHDLKSTESGFLTKYVLGEEPPRGMFSSPVDVASNGSGKIYVTDSGLRQVLVLDLKKQNYRFMASAGTNFAAAYGVSSDNEGRLYVTSPVRSKVDVFSKEESLLFAIEDPELSRPVAVAVDSERDRIYVVDTAKHRLAIYDLKGNSLGYLGERGVEPGQFNFPVDVDIDDDGFLYVLDALNARVQVFDQQRQFVKMFGERGTAVGSFQIPKNLAVGNNGQVYVTDGLGHKMVIFDREGQLLLRIGGKSVAEEGLTPGGFSLPRGIDVDQNGTIWVADTFNRMIHRFQYLNTQYLSEHPLD